MKQERSDLILKFASMDISIKSRQIRISQRNLRAQFRYSKFVEDTPLISISTSTPLLIRRISISETNTLKDLLSVVEELDSVPELESELGEQFSKYSIVEAMRIFLLNLFITFSLSVITLKPVSY